jgi:nucleotide-binding universal stress UspA family protein
MRSGRPVLVVPFAGTFGAVGKRVIIAWNGSREAARALNDALPMLAGAEEVTVLALSPSRVAARSDAAGSAAIIRHLTAHGVEAAADRLVFKAREIDPAERLLSHLADYGADLLVMGAWPRAGERNSLTTGVLARTTVPMLLSY